MDVFINGFLMGLSYVAPIGVQNLFVINTAIKEKLDKVILTAFIVMFFDISLSLACFFGVGAILESFQSIKNIILVVGSIFVIYMGITIINSKPDLPMKIIIPYQLIE